ncbi:cytochrome c3 family protein [Shewanella sp. 10N.286.52.B9]|uniref:multiheme c-type cytochrome n=1 Tax=Shewanella sp. 10N.286.52.B9 TaxID=1880837 RepID=UPI001F52FDE0|nr:cytochrome c3 family protein [Shewanella sp. 10N.286.52.B9]
MMMKHLTKRKLAFVIAAAMGIAGCGSDGKDGAPGEPGPGPTPPVVETSTVTNVEIFNHTLEEGMVKFDFEISDEEGVLISGLEKASVEFAELTDKGIARSRDDFEGTILGGSASDETEGASLTEVADGHYEFVAPIENINAASEGIIRLAVGGGENIAKSSYIVVDKTAGIHTTSTAACYECHVDYAEFGTKHPHYTAINTDGEADFLGGCMTCHGNVTKDDGGYATNTMQKIGHINHMNFETGFEGSNCYTCHAEPVTMTYSETTCSDCHQAAGMNEYVDMNAFAADTDFRRLHTKFPTQVEVNEVHYSVMSEVVAAEDGLSSCSTYSLFNTEGETATLLNTAEMLAAGDITIAITYQRLISNVIDTVSGTTTFTDNEDGSREYCIEYVAPEGEALSMLARTTFQTNEDDKVILAALSENGRRLNVTQESCTTCHNVAGEFHGGAGFADGGASCLSCHSAGNDRASARTVAMDAFLTDKFRIDAGYTIPAMDRNDEELQIGWKAISAPGFGPMIHARHWGNQPYQGSELDSRGNEVLVANSALKLSAESCVSCHATVVDLNKVPAQFMPSKSMNGGTSGVYTSQITANCAGCHTEDIAISHMTDNGGEINKPEADFVDEWFLAPTSESCATCHAEGKSFGIEKFHNFER